MGELYRSYQTAKKKGNIREWVVRYIIQWYKACFPCRSPVFTANIKKREIKKTITSIPERKREGSVVISIYSIF